MNSRDQVGESDRPDWGISISTVIRSAGQERFSKLAHKPSGELMVASHTMQQPMVDQGLNRTNLAIMHES
jgi:hypothetical protein